MTNRETTVALTGNTFIAQPIRGIDNPGFHKTVEYLRAADVALTNLECGIPDPEIPPAFVAGSGWGATYMIGTPSMVLRPARSTTSDQVYSGSARTSSMWTGLPSITVLPTSVPRLRPGWLSAMNFRVSSE